MTMTAESMRATNALDQTKSPCTALHCLVAPTNLRRRHIRLGATLMLQSTLLFPALALRISASLVARALGSAASRAGEAHGERGYSTYGSPGDLG